MAIESHLSPVFTASSTAKSSNIRTAPVRTGWVHPAHGLDIPPSVLCATSWCNSCAHADQQTVQLHALQSQSHAFPSFPTWHGVPALSGWSGLQSLPMYNVQLCMCSDCKPLQLDRAGPPCQNSLTNLSAGMVCRETSDNPNSFLYRWCFPMHRTAPPRSSCVQRMQFKRLATHKLSLCTALNTPDWTQTSTALESCRGLAQ